jgi:hypothetical protein
VHHDLLALTTPPIFVHEGVDQAAPDFGKQVGHVSGDGTEVAIRDVRGDGGQPLLGLALDDDGPAGGTGADDVA